MTKHTATNMNPTIAASTKTMIASSADSFRWHLAELRFAVGIAICLGGASVMLSQLISLATSLG